MVFVKVALFVSLAFTHIMLFCNHEIVHRSRSALAPLIYLVFCGAPASHFYTSAAPVAAPAAAAAAPPAAPVAVNAAGVVPLPADEVLDPNEVIHKATSDKTKNSYCDTVTDFCVWLYDEADNGEFVLAREARTELNTIDAQYADDTPKGKKQRFDAMRAKLKEWLIVDEKKEKGSSQQHKLINFGRYKAEVAVQYMCSRKKIEFNHETQQREERLLGSSRYSAIRTAIMTYLADVYGHEWSQRNLQYMAKALRRPIKRKTKAGEKIWSRVRSP